MVSYVLVLSEITYFSLKLFTLHLRLLLQHLCFVSVHPRSGVTTPKKVPLPCYLRSLLCLALVQLEDNLVAPEIYESVKKKKLKCKITMSLVKRLSLHASQVAHQAELIPVSVAWSV